MIAVWIPVTVVPRSSATVAIDTFMTELSNVIRNCPDASVRSTIPEVPTRLSVVSMASTYSAPSPLSVTPRDPFQL